MKITGCIPPMVTPCRDESGEIATKELRSYTEFLRDGGVHGVFPCGSTGEFTSLSRDQRRVVIQTVADVMGDGLVLAGCGDTSATRVEALIRDAETAGADAAVVVTPYYLPSSQESLALFYKRIADGSPLPILLYDIPSLTGNSLSVETVIDLAKHDNIVGHKLSASDFIQFRDLVDGTPDTFDVLAGYPELTIQALAVGGDGVIPGAANVFPSVIADVYDTFVQGQPEEALSRFCELLIPLYSAIRSVPTVPALKYLVTRRGFDVGPSLPPLPELTRTHQETLDVRYDEIAQTL